MRLGEARQIGFDVLPQAGREFLPLMSLGDLGEAGKAKQAR
jgi:hypothetical protein